MIGYVKCFESIKAMFFKDNDNNLLKRYTKIQKKISSLMDVEFNSESVYGDNDKYIKTKIKAYRHEITTNFQGKKYQKKMHHINVYH